MAIIEKGLDYMIPGLHIATASEWKRRGYKIRDSEAPVLKIKIWKPVKEWGLILVDAHFYDVTQIERLMDDIRHKEIVGSQKRASWLSHFSYSSTTKSGTFLKCPSSVTIANPCAFAVAAIHISFSGIRFPVFLKNAFILAYSSVTFLVIGK